MRYGTCFLCGKTGWLEEHHVYPGPFRDKSEKYGLKVGLCGESCHRNGRYAAHQCRETSDALKQFWQIKYMMAHKASVADFRAAFGKNYLELDYYDDERSYPMNIIAISGRLTRDPELRTTPNGKPVMVSVRLDELMRLLQAAAAVCHHEQEDKKNAEEEKA